MDGKSAETLTVGEAVRTVSGVAVFGIRMILCDRTAHEKIYVTIMLQFDYDHKTTKRCFMIVHYDSQVRVVLSACCPIKGYPNACTSHVKFVLNRSLSKKKLYKDGQKQDVQLHDPVSCIITACSCICFRGCTHRHVFAHESKMRVCYTIWKKEMQQL